MSIQDARESIAKNTGALLGADAKFFQSVQTRFDAMKAKDGHVSDFRRLLGEVSAWGQTFAGKANWNGAKDQPVYDGVTGWADLINAEIDMKLIAAGAGLGKPANPSGWKNAETGAPVQILAKSDKLADQSYQPKGASLGEVLEGIVLGAKTETVRNALSEGVDSAGGYSIPTTVLPEFIDKLRAASTFIQAGAQTLILDGARTRIMRTATDPVCAWRAENAAVTESDPTFNMISFEPKSLAVLVKVSLEILQDSVNVADALEASLIGALSTELDRACLFGLGASSEPLGLFGQTGVNSVSMGTNGATPTSYDEWIDALYENELDNSAPATAAILHPRTLKTLRKLKDTTNQPLQLPPALQGLPQLASTSVPITQTQGTATSMCSTVLIGDFTQAILGLRQQLVIRRLDQTFAGNLQVGFLAYLRADTGFANPQSFAKIIGVKA